MAKLVTLKRQSGEAVYPVTVTAAVMDSNGNPAEVVFAKKQDSVSSKSSDKGVEVELGGTLASPTVKVNVTSSGITSDNNSVAIASDVFKYAAKNEVFKGAKAATSTSVAEAGKIGLVPAPASGATTKYLKSDGNWSDVDAAKLEGLRSGDFTRCLQGTLIGIADTKPKYILLAQLPTSASNTYDAVHINGYFGDYLINAKNIVNIVVGRRGGLEAFGLYQRNTSHCDLVVNTSGEVLLKCNYAYMAYSLRITVNGATLQYIKNYTPLDTEFTNVLDFKGVTHLDKDGVVEKAKSDANGSEISTTYVKNADTIQTTYDTDKGVKVELSGTFDAPKIDVTTTLGDVTLSNSSNAVSGETIAKSVPLLKATKGVAFSKGDDLNTSVLCDVGTYYAITGNVAKSLLNCPTKTSFLMVVTYPSTYADLNGGGYVYVVRKILDIAGCEWVQRVYTQGNNIITYGQWIRILREDTTFTQATTSTANGTQVVNAGTGGAVPAPRTLEDNNKFLKGNGTWSAIPTSSVGSGITLPATGNAVHEALTGTTYINTIGTDFIDNLFDAKG